MRDDGFTLTEMLAALLIIGLAFGGLFEATRQIGRVQTKAGQRVAESRSLREAESRFQAWLDTQEAAAAIEGARFNGDARSMTYPCGAGTCRLSLTNAGDRWEVGLSGRDQGAQTLSLGRASDPHLVYDAIDGRFDHWPPSGRFRSLRAVSIVQSGDDGDQPVLTARTWIEQTRTCQYDLISRACRLAGTP